jgi:hypothetical protein
VVASPTCAKCGQVIPPDDINVAKDVAYCRLCNLAHKLSSLTSAIELEAGIDFANPPAGTWQQQDGLGTLIGATHRSVGGALGLLAMCLFWNGIVSVFVALATASTLHLMNLPVPAWFPSPGPVGTGMTIFLWLFLTPFIAIGLGLIGAFFLTLAGHTQVSLDGNEASIFTGVGSIGYRRRFDPQVVTDVRIDDQRWRDSDGDYRRTTCILIETAEGRKIKFGSMLAEERRRFIAASLRRALLG